MNHSPRKGPLGPALFTLLAAATLGLACGQNGNASTPVSEAGSDATGEQDAADSSSPTEAGHGSNEASDSAVPPTEAGEEAGEAGGPDATADAMEAGSCAWTPYNSGLTGASISDILFDTRGSSEVVYASSAQTLYASTDGGDTWTTRGSFAGGSIGYLAAPGTNPSVLVATSTAGVIESTDAGHTWSLLAFGGTSIGTSGGLAFAPSEPQRAYVGIPGAAVFRSDDGASTWTAAGNGFPSAYTFTISVAPDDADELVTASELLTAQGAGSGNGVVMRSTDAGQTWQTVLQGTSLGSPYGDVWVVRRCPANPAILYAATAAGVVSSMDRGVTWTVHGLTGDAGAIYPIEIAINPANCSELYAMTEFHGPYHSTDGGVTFAGPLATGLDPISLGYSLSPTQVDPAHPTNLVTGSHAGIWTSSNSAASWTQAQGLLGLSVSSIVSSPQQPNQVWMATYGQGVWRQSSLGGTWQRIPASALPVDYALAATPDPNVANRLWVGAWFDLYQSGDDGSTFTDDGVSKSEFAFAFDPTNTSVVYAGTQEGGLYKSTNGGMTWSPSNGSIVPWLTPAGTFIDVRQVVVDPGSPQTVYLGTNGGGVFKSTDGASVWTNVLAPTGQIHCLLITPGSPETMYACVAGMGIQSSQDGGQTWNSVSSTLPTLDVNGLAFDATTGNLYAACDDGVYVWNGTKWSAFDAACSTWSTSTPAVIGTGTQRLLVVAAGGGVYSHPL